MSSDTKESVTGLDNQQANEWKPSDRVRLNVGGNKFETTVSTLMTIEKSFFALMLTNRGFKLDKDKEDTLQLFVDRDGTHFRHILNYLREPGTFSARALDLTAAELHELAKESNFYQLPGLLKHLGTVVDLEAEPCKVWLELSQESLAVPAALLAAGFVFEGQIRGGKAEFWYLYSSSWWPSPGAWRELSQRCRGKDRFLAASSLGHTIASDE